MELGKCMLNTLYQKKWSLAHTSWKWAKHLLKQGAVVQACASSFSMISYALLSVLLYWDALPWYLKYILILLGCRRGGKKLQFPYMVWEGCKPCSKMCACPLAVNTFISKFCNTLQVKIQHFSPKEWFTHASSCLGISNVRLLKNLLLCWIMSVN